MGWDLWDGIYRLGLDRVGWSPWDEEGRVFGGQLTSQNSSTCSINGVLQETPPLLS